MHRDDLVRMADSSVFMHRITRDEARSVVDLLDDAERRVRDAELRYDSAAAELASTIRRSASALGALADSLDR